MYNVTLEIIEGHSIGFEQLRPHSGKLIWSLYMPLSSLRKKTKKLFLRGILTFRLHRTVSVEWSYSVKSSPLSGPGMAEELLAPSAYRASGASGPGRESRSEEHSRWAFISRPFPSPAICPFLPEYTGKPQLESPPPGDGGTESVLVGFKWEEKGGAEGQLSTRFLFIFFHETAKREGGRGKRGGGGRGGTEKKQKLRQDRVTIGAAGPGGSGAGQRNCRGGPEEPRDGDSSTCPGRAHERDTSCFGRNKPPWLRHGALSWPSAPRAEAVPFPCRTAPERFAFPHLTPVLQISLTGLASCKVLNLS